MNVKKLAVAVIIAGLLAGTTPALAQTNSIQELIAKLQRQIAELKAKLQALEEAQRQAREAGGEAEETFAEIRRELRQGTSGGDVQIIQQLLALDPEVYPRGLITGYYGKRTENAIKKFQRKHGLAQTGHVGPKTLKRLNKQLAGNVHPSVRNLLRKLCALSPELVSVNCGDYARKPKRDKRNGTSTPDTLAPIISNVMATSTTASTTIIKWSTVNDLTRGRVWYATTSPVMIRPFALKAASPSLAEHHGVHIGDLTASTTHYYFIAAEDAAGNRATSSEESFTTR